MVSSVHLVMPPENTTGIWTTASADIDISFPDRLERGVVDAVARVDVKIVYLETQNSKFSGFTCKDALRKTVCEMPLFIISTNFLRAFRVCAVCALQFFIT